MLPDALPTCGSNDPTTALYIVEEVEEDDEKDRKAIARLHEARAKIFEYLRMSMLINLLGLSLKFNFLLQSSDFVNLSRA